MEAQRQRLKWLTKGESTSIFNMFNDRHRHTLPSMHSKNKLNKTYENSLEDSTLNQSCQKEDHRRIKEKIMEKMKLAFTSNKEQRLIRRTTIDRPEIHKESTSTHYLTLYLDHLQNQKPTDCRVRKTHHQKSQKLEKSQKKVQKKKTPILPYEQACKMTFRRIATNNLLEQFNHFFERQNLKTILEQVLKCYNLLSSFDYKQSQITRMIKECISQKKSICKIFIKKHKISNDRQCHESTSYVNNYQQLVESIRALYLLQDANFPTIIKQIEQYKILLQTRVTRSICNRIDEIQRSIRKKNADLKNLTQIGSQLYVPLLSHIKVARQPDKYQCCQKISAPEKDVFARLSKYFERATTVFD